MISRNKTLHYTITLLTLNLADKNCLILEMVDSLLAKGPSYSATTCSCLPESHLKIPVFELPRTL